jgi:L-alanine-DL-glutamate epimerase-like enolase superfamily enzyme
VNQSSAAWSRAYAIQARAELKARDVLISEQALPTCQQLHFLHLHEAGRSYVKVIQVAADELASGLYAAK